MATITLFSKKQTVLLTDNRCLFGLMARPTQNREHYGFRVMLASKLAFLLYSKMFEAA
jgi:hypothetical protein